MTVLSLPDIPQRREIQVSHWVLSALVILLLHVGAMLALIEWRVPQEAGEPPPAAIMIDLVPNPVPQPNAPVLLPEPPQEIEPPPIVAPPAPAPQAAVALPPPQPKRVQRQPVRRHKVAPPRIPVPQPPAQSVAEDPPTVPQTAPRQGTPVTTSAAAPAPEALSNFEKLLLSHLEREKRYPRPAQLRREQGIVSLRFTMDRAGQVLSARVERSSGYQDLDAEVLALIKRAEPLPALPPDITGSQLELVVPVKFFLR